MEKDYRIDQTKLLNFINQKRRNNICSCCWQNNRHVWIEAYELRAFRWGNMIVWWIPIIPLVPITCNNCWNTILVNAMVARLFDNKKDDVTEQK